MKRGTVSERVFSWLVSLYPSEYRDRHGQDLEILFRDMRRDAGRRRFGGLRLWATTVLGLVRTLPREHFVRLMQDAGFALRMMRRHVGFTAVAVGTMALGIGATTTVFSVVNGILLRPLPYAEPDRLVWVTAGEDTREGKFWLSPPEFQELRADATSFSSLSAAWIGTVTQTDVEPLEQVRYGWATHEFLETLGVALQLGRWFTALEEQPGNHEVAVLSHEYWQRRFGGRPDVLGRTIELNEATHTVVGVLPEGFTLIQDAVSDRLPPPEFWIPQYIWGQGRRSRWLVALGRLDGNVTLAGANTELAGIAQSMAGSHDDYAGTGLRLQADSMLEEIVADAKPAILALLGAVGFVLLLACANVANLLLARMTARTAELAVRAELGAGRSRLLRQLLTENVVLAGVGGTAGIVIALLGVDLLVRLNPANLPRLDGVRVDGSVLAFAVGASMLTGLLIGIFPAMKAVRTAGGGIAHHASRTTAGGRWSWTRRTLVFAQVGLALVLLSGAGLMVRTFVELQRADIGFDEQDVFTIRVPVSSEAHPFPDAYWSFYRTLRDEVDQMPGVSASGAVSVLPLSGGVLRAPVGYDPDTHANWGSAVADYRAVVPGYFRTLGVQVVAGRPFTDADRSSDRPLLVIDETFASHVWPGESALGRRVTMQDWRARGQLVRVDAEVIGVVRHVRTSNVREDGHFQLYAPVWSLRTGEMALTIRASADAAALGAAIRRVTSRLGSDRAVHTGRWLEEYVRDATAESRFALALIGVFAAIALVIAGVGVYGAVSYDVAARQRELGVRIALGAKGSSVVGLTLRQGIGVVAVGVVAGIAGAIALTRYLASMLFGVSPTDPSTLAIMALLLLAIAAAACWIPARRAAAVDPVLVLKE